ACSPRCRSTAPANQVSDPTSATLHASSAGTRTSSNVTTTIPASATPSPATARRSGLYAANTQKASTYATTPQFSRRPPGTSRNDTTTWTTITTTGIANGHLRRSSSGSVYSSAA